MISFIKRVWNFERQDWKHISFLFKNMIKQYCIMEYGEAKEAYILIKMHLMFDSTLSK